MTNNLIQGVPLLLGGSAAKLELAGNIFDNVGQVADMDEVAEFIARQNLLIRTRS